MTHVAETLFEPDDHGVVATALARGPWDPRHCHGGPVAALLARAVEQIDLHDAEPSIVDWQITRLTIELTRPVPVLAPLTLATRVDRPGRKVSLVSAVLAHDDVEVAAVKALRVRRSAVELPDTVVVPDEPTFALPSAARADQPAWREFQDVTAFHSHGCELRFVEGSWSVPGPAAVWVRLAAPVVPGEAPTGVQRAAVAADIGNGMSASLPYPTYRFINPDLSISLLRPPVGEWIGVRSASVYGPEGAGMVDGALYDVETSTVGGEAHDAVRRVGRAVNSVLVERL